MDCRWNKSNRCIEYLTKFGKRLDIEYLPYIDQYVAKAYQDVLSKGDTAFTGRQLEVLEENPFLRDAFTGSEIDRVFKDYIKTEDKIPKGTYEIVEVGNAGADLYYMQNGARSNWWGDITTKKQADAHFSQYGGNGYVTHIVNYFDDRWESESDWIDKRKELQIAFINAESLKEYEKLDLRGIKNS